MTDDDQGLIYSPLCQTLTRDGKSVAVYIYDDGNDGWLLETVDQYGNSTVWDLPFPSDTEALDEALKTIEEEGIEVLIGFPSTPQNANSEQATSGLSVEEMDELGRFLWSDATPDDAMIMDCLDGFLTALVSAPVMLSPSVWLPKVWGESTNNGPAFKNAAQAERIISLIMRHLNGIIWSLHQDPDTFEPIFDIAFYEGDPHEYVDAEMWASGYITGIHLQDMVWEPFFDEPASDEVLRPIYLLGADDVMPEEYALTETPIQRERLSEQIPASLAWIYRFWQPYRTAVAERNIATNYQREHPKFGRNALCPCGSGKKFKKCCGASTVLY